MNLIVSVAKSVTRLLAFIGRELIEVRRRPGALASLVFGPFLVMAIFGLGYNGYKKPLATLIVIPPSSELPTDVETYRNVAGAGLEIVDVVPDATTANARLESGEVEVVAIAPENARSTFKSGKQSTIEVRVDLADPVQAAYAGLMADQFANAAVTGRREARNSALGVHQYRHRRPLHSKDLRKRSSGLFLKQDRAARNVCELLPICLDSELRDEHEFQSPGKLFFPLLDIGGERLARTARWRNEHEENR